MLNRFDENGNAEIENQADQWEEQQAILQADAEESRADWERDQSRNLYE